MKSSYENEFSKRPLSQFLTKISRSSFSENFLRTRDSTFITMPAIPTGKNDFIYDKIKKILVNWRKIQDYEKNSAIAGILKFSIELPVYSLINLEKKDTELYDKFGMNFVDSDYSSEIGLIPNKKNVLIL